MASKPKSDEPADRPEAKGKLGRLLETESELDALLRATEDEVRERIAAAQEAAALRLRELEMELDAADRDLRGRVTADRDEAVSAIRSDAARRVKQLERIEGARLDELARFVLSHVLSAEPEEEL